MMDFFRGQTVDKMELDGLQHVICVSAGEQVQDPSSTKEDLPTIFFRVYLVRSRKVAGSKVPKIELEEMGPRMDMKLGRWQEANEDMMSQALKKPKDTTVVYLLGSRLMKVKTKKNVEIDTIGDTLGRIHVGQQDLRKLQTRKMRGLKRRAGEGEEGDGKRARMGGSTVSTVGDEE
jgi:ribosome production factor 2